MPRPPKKRDWLPIITFIISILGALAWASPLLYELWQRPVVKGKMVGLTYSVSKNSTYDPIAESTLTLSGSSYYPKLILTSLRGDFTIRKVEVFVKYQNDPKTYSGTTFYAPAGDLLFDRGDGTFEHRVLRIPPEEHVATLFVIERGKVTPVWIPFVVDKTPFAFFEQVEFRFTDYEGRKQSVFVKAEEIDVRNAIFESKYWSEASPEK
jgi:hypothetical protein